MKADALTCDSKVVVCHARAASVSGYVRDVENTCAHIHVLPVAGPVKEKRDPICFTGQTDIGSLVHA